MASADFCSPISTRYRADSTGQANRSPWVMRATFLLIPAAYTSMLSVQVSGFEDIGLLTRHDRLVCDFCSSGQHFACGFLQIPSRDGHPCRPASSSPCRACGGLSPPSHQAGTTPARMALTHHAHCRAHPQRRPTPKINPEWAERSQYSRFIRSCACSAILPMRRNPMPGGVIMARDPNPPWRRRTWRGWRITTACVQQKKNQDTQRPDLH